MKVGIYMDKKININDTEFYGFLNSMDIIAAGKVTELLRNDPKCKIYENDTNASVVEEIVRRGGTFYDGIETKKFAPWDHPYTDVYSAKFGYLDGEPRPVNPNYAEYDWCLLNPIQYMYGKYLQEEIANGNLSTDKIIKRTD